MIGEAIVVSGAAHDERAQHLDRLVAAAVPRQQFRQRHRPVYPRHDGVVEPPKDLGSAGDVAALLQQLREALCGVAVVVGRGIGPQLLDPVVPGEQVGELVAAVDRSALAGGSTVATATRRRTYLAPLALTITRIVAVLAIVIAGAAVYQTYRIGGSGAKASWTDKFTSTPVQDRPGRPDGH